MWAPVEGRNVGMGHGPRTVDDGRRTGDGGPGTGGRRTEDWGRRTGELTIDDGLWTMVSIVYCPWSPVEPNLTNDPAG